MCSRNCVLVSYASERVESCKITVVSGTFNSLKVGGERDTQITFDGISTSPSVFTKEHKTIWKENLSVCQKSLKAFYYELLDRVAIHKTTSLMISTVR